MSKVKRVEIDHKGLPFFDENGVYVFYEDYAELQKKLDELLAENSNKGTIRLRKLCLSATTRGEREEMIQLREEDIEDIRAAGYQVEEL